MKLHGKVVIGLGIGTKLGYPTANLECGDVEYPAPGVYAARATVDSATYHAALIIGARGDNGRPLVEVHILDFHDDLLGNKLTVDVLNKISEIEKSENNKELVQKIEHDIQLIKKNSA